jgi:hypothetical protein
MAKKRSRPAANDPSRYALTSGERTELENEWRGLRGDASEAAARRLTEIEERLRRAEWALQAHFAEMGDDAPPRVRAILSAFSGLSTEEWRNLSGRLHNCIHPEWTVVQTAGLNEAGRALHRMTNQARYYARNEQPEDNPERNAKVIELWAGGPKVAGGMGPKQILLIIKKDYPHWVKNKDVKRLTPGAIAHIIKRHQEREAERREAGL